MASAGGNDEDKQKPTLKQLGIREIMEQMESIVEVKYSGGYGRIITEADPLQRRMRVFFS
jgi:hypothetical protein